MEVINKDNTTQEEFKALIVKSPDFTVKTKSVDENGVETGKFEYKNIFKSPLLEQAIESYVGDFNKGLDFYCKDSVSTEEFENVMNEAKYTPDQKQQLMAKFEAGCYLTVTSQE